MRRTTVTASLLALATLAVAAETAPPAPTPATKPVVVAGTQPIRFSGQDLGTVAKVRFFASNNRGQTWILASEMTIDPANPVAPQLDFKAPADGTWAFVTTATLRDGRTEPEPVAGVLPPNALIAEVDNTAPVVGDVQGTIDNVAADNITVGVTWSASEANPAGTIVEVSGDLGRTFVAAPSDSLQGYVKVTVPRAAGADSVLLKITVRDAAGNSASSAPRSIPLPKNPEQKLADAVAALPAPADIAPVERPEVAVNTPAVVEPTGAGTTTTATTTAVVTPAATTPVTPAVVVVPAPPAPVDFPAGRAPGPLPTPGFLRGSATDDVLADARALALHGDTAESLDRYVALRVSDQAGTAIGEELALRNRTGDAAGVVAAFADLAPELRTDDARVETARAHLTLTNPDAAVTVLNRLGRASARYREALLLVAVAREAQGRQGEATKLYEHLATGDDAVAAEAKARRGK